MNCPYCGCSERMSVTETRAVPEGRINRRRRCPGCGKSFATVERLSEDGLFVRKAGGEVVPFSRKALRSGIERAVIGRYPVPKLEALVNDVIRDVYQQAEGPILSSEIGASVMRALREVDEVSHIRFALVHTGRQDRAGWNRANHVRRWLVEEYPQLQYFRPPAGLSEVIKRDGRRVPYVRSKLQKNIEHSAKGQGSSEAIETFASEIADAVERELGSQPFVMSGQIAAEVMRILRHRNHIAYLRYASLVKGFRTPEDYEAEAVALRHDAGDAVDRQD
jgi:transcriptional repressor NrdR